MACRKPKFTQYKEPKFGVPIPMYVRMLVRVNGQPQDLYHGTVIPNCQVVQPT